MEGMRYKEDDVLNVTISDDGRSITCDGLISRGVPLSGANYRYDTNKWIQFYKEVAKTLPHLGLKEVDSIVDTCRSKDATSLGVKNYFFDHDTFTKLVVGLKGIGLKIFTLEGVSGINDVCATSLDGFLQSCKTLEKLIVRFTDIGDNGAAAIAKFLRNKSSLSFLHMKECGISDMAMVNIADAVRDGTSHLRVEIYREYDKSEEINPALLAFIYACESRSQLELYIEDVDLGDWVLKISHIHRLISNLSPDAKRILKHVYLNFSKKSYETLVSGTKIPGLIDKSPLQYADQSVLKYITDLSVEVTDKEFYDFVTHISPETLGKCIGLQPRDRESIYYILQEQASITERFERLPAVKKARQELLALRERQHEQQDSEPAAGCTVMRKL